MCFKKERIGFLLLMWSLGCLCTYPAESITAIYEAEDIKPSLVAKIIEDSMASGGRAVSVNIESLQKPILMEPSYQVSPGRYRVTIRMRVDSINHFGTALVFGVFDENKSEFLFSRKIYGLHFTGAGKYEEFFVEGFIEGSGEIRCAVYSQSAKSYGGKSQPDITETVIDWIRVERVEGDVVITKVLPDKIHYWRNEDAKLFVTLRNNSRVQKKVRLRCVLFSQLDKEREIHDGPITLEPNSSKEISVPFNSGEEEFGFEVRALVLKDSKLLDQQSEYFSVSDNLWKVAITGGGDPGKVPNPPVVTTGTPGSRYMQQELPKDYWNFMPPKDFRIYPELYQDSAREFRRNYVNFWEFFGWAPDDFFLLAPSCGEDDLWWSGEGTYLLSKRKIKTLIDTLHKQGIKCISYVNPYGIGAPSFEWVRRKPDWFLYMESGQLMGRDLSPAQWDTQYFRMVEQTEYMPTYRMESSVALNMTKKDLVDFGIAQIIASTKMFGWDGMRVDNGFYRVMDGYDFSGKKCYGEQNMDDLSVEILKYIKKRLRDELGPRFAIGGGGNRGGVPQYPKSWIEWHRGGCLNMLETTRSAYAKGQPLHSWKRWVNHIRDESEPGRLVGGQTIIVGFDNYHLVDHLYMQIFTYAMGVHPYAFQYRGWLLPFANYAQFATRFSQYIWGEDIRRTEDPVRLLSVDTPQGQKPWWEDFTYERKTGKKHQIIVHLVNPPVKDVIFEDPTNQVPTALHGLHVSLNIPTGSRLQRVWLLTAEPETRGLELEVKMDGNHATVIVPELRFWNILVWDCDLIGKT